MSVLKDIFTGNFVSKEIEEARFKECRGCVNFIKPTQQCGLCYCFMPAKVKLFSAECPADPPKWM